MDSVEIRYLDIVWSADQTVLKVEESDQPVELEKIGQHWRGDTVTYPQKYFHIGVCINEKVLYTPYLKLANNETSPLIPIKVPGIDKTWWVQGGRWDKRYKKYLSTLYRTAGRIEVSVQDELIILDNHTVNFSVEDLEYYLSDLKDKLWMLMLDNKSASKIGVEKETPTVFSSDVIKLFGDLASSFEAIIKKPHVILSETQEKLPWRSVKPVAKTFREVATQSSPKLLTSRSYTESYNTPENRYVHYLAFRALYLLKALSRLASHQSNAMRDKLEREERWLKEESNRITKKVDPIVFDNEINAIAQDIENQRRLLEEAAQAPLDSRAIVNFDQAYNVVLGNSYRNSSTEFFVTLLNGDDFKKSQGTYLIFSSNIAFKKILNTEFIRPYEFKITGSGIKSKKTNNNGNIYYEIRFSQITSIDTLRSPLKQEFARLQKTRAKLVENDWISKLSRDELDSIHNQVQILRTRLGAIEGSLGQLDDFFSHTPYLIARIKKSILFFQMHKVRRQQEPPNSMVFVQNPVYSAAKSLYQKVSNLEGMDDSLLNTMMAVDEIGLVNLPNLYERWCLLQLVVVISDVYRFRLNGNWQRKLINSVLNNDINVELHFSSYERQLDLKLTYEKELDSGKRPDYVIDLHYKTYASNSNKGPFSIESPATIQWHIDKDKATRMVLDAKFRGDVSEQHIADLVENLYERKNYSEDGINHVFVVHPVAKITDERTSPLDWGSYCNYGQSDETDHKKGSVYLSPSREHRNSIENLQRLVAMLLQNHTSILDDEGRQSVVWHNKSCVSCGGNDLSISLIKTTGGNERNIIYCNSCQQKTDETQCVSCGRRLYKNGIKWTYHRTRAEQTTNVVCPQCETFL